MVTRYSQNLRVPSGQLIVG